MRFFSVITQDTHIGERYTCCARTPCACVSVIKVPRKLAHSLASAMRALACSILIRDIVAQSVSVVGYQSSMSRPPAEQAPREPVTYSSGSVMSGESVRQHGLSVPITLWLMPGAGDSACKCPLQGALSSMQTTRRANSWRH